MRSRKECDRFDTPIIWTSKYVFQLKISHSNYKKFNFFGYKLFKSEITPGFVEIKQVNRIAVIL